MKNEHPNTADTLLWTLHNTTEFHLVILTWTYAIIFLNALNNSYWPVETWGQEVSKNILIEDEDMAAKLQRSLLELHSFPFTAKAERKKKKKKKRELEPRHKGDWGGGHFPAFKRLINNKLIQEKRRSSVWHRFQARQASKLSTGELVRLQTSALKHYTCLCACSRHVC